jgi:YHS domain-containing protein
VQVYQFIEDVNRLFNCVSPLRFDYSKTTETAADFLPSICLERVDNLTSHLVCGAQINGTAYATLRYEGWFCTEQWFSVFRRKPIKNQLIPIRLMPYCCYQGAGECVPIFRRDQ